MAGLFYPGEPQALRRTLDGLLAAALDAPRAALPRPPAKALIVPHAGYVYSGPVAAAAYASLRERRAAITRVVLIGPSHRTYCRGIAVPAAASFETPLGEVPVDAEARALALAQPGVFESDEPHADEHCLEVQLPFLQVVLGTFTLLPLLAGEASTDEVGGVLAAVWGGPETLVVVSSDLSHYHRYAAAQAIDAATAAQIVARQPNLTGDQACGAVAVNGLLARARQLDLRVAELARLNSGDTAGDRSRVVGYGAWSLHDAR